jgi:hypothetical protein
MKMLPVVFTGLIILQVGRTFAIYSGMSGVLSVINKLFLLWILVMVLSFLYFLVATRLSGVGISKGTVTFIYPHSIIFFRLNYYEYPIVPTGFIFGEENRLETTSVIVFAMNGEKKLHQIGLSRKDKRELEYILATMKRLSGAYTKLNKI